MKFNKNQMLQHANHMETIKEWYNQLLDEGIPITELYIYNLIINDERSYGMSEKEIENMVEDVIDKRYDTADSIETIIDNLLNGDEYDGDENR